MRFYKQTFQVADSAILEAKVEADHTGRDYFVGLSGDLAIASAPNRQEF